MPTAATIDAPADAAAMLAPAWRLVCWHSCRFAARFDLDADEIAQGAAVAILTQFDRFDPARGSFKRWAFLMTRQAALRLSQTRRRRRAMLSLDLLTEDGDRLHEPADPGALDPADAAEAAELRAAVRAAVEKLPPRERAVVQARYAEGMEQEQIGEALGLTRQRVSQIEARAIIRVADGASPRRPNKDAL